MSKKCWGHNEAMRDRVNLSGYSEFSKIETEGIFNHFAVENTIKKDG